ncbi:MAG: hypothetical protein J7K65_06490, partial [Planctomycetes bacterium]|nr:hypothetical protein [Planctomycetota bacterium]
ILNTTASMPCRIGIFVRSLSFAVRWFRRISPGCLRMTAAIVSHTTFNTKQIADGLDEGFLDATALAEYLVRKGIPFRQAHGIVGSLVAQCEDEGKKKLGELTIDQFKAACDKIEQGVFDTLDPTGVCKSYKSAGAAGPEAAKSQIHYWKGKLKEQ